MTKSHHESPRVTASGKVKKLIDHSWSLVVIRGHSWSFVVTRGHSWLLVVIRGHSWSFVDTRGHSCVLLDTICHDELFTSVQFDSETWNSITNFGNKVESLDMYTNVAACDGRRENWSCNRVIIVVSCKSLQDKEYGLGCMLSIPFDILSSLWNKTKTKKKKQESSS